MGIVIPPWDENMVKMVKCLVVEPPSPLKNDGVSSSVGMIVPNCFWKVIKFHGSKAPISEIW